MIIGLTGTYGAGKGAIVDYLVNKKAFKHYSARELIRVVLDNENIPSTRDTLIDMGNRLRAEHGPDYIVRTLFKKAKKNGGDAVIESLRATAEAKYMKEQDGVVIGVDAEPALRYKRMIQRGTETDSVTFEQWEKQQRTELNPTDPTKQDMYGALQESDYLIMNNGTLEALHEKVDAVLRAIS